MRIQFSAPAANRGADRKQDTWQFFFLIRRLDCMKHLPDFTRRKKSVHEVGLWLVH
jgi:hypothetical protein